MKKRYEKPQIVFEDFALSTNIAANCEHQTSLQTEGACGLDFGGDMIFLINVTGCKEKYDVDDGQFNGICYHVPIETSNLFNS